MDIDVYTMTGGQKAKHDLMMKSEVYGTMLYFFCDIVAFVLIYDRT